MGTQTAQLLRQEKSLRDGKTQQGSHEQLPTTESPLLTKAQWLLQSKGGKEPASGGTLRRGRWESAHLSKPGKAGAPVSIRHSPHIRRVMVTTDDANTHVHLECEMLPHKCAPPHKLRV